QRIIWIHHDQERRTCDSALAAIQLLTYVDEISRRDFLVLSALTGVGITKGLAVAAAVAQDPAGPAPDWFDRPMRWAQLTLVENDPGRYEPQFWLDYFSRIHADAACLSAGGVVAYYPTKIPLHHRSAWMRD